jgi:hypothetical protein
MAIALGWSYQSSVETSEAHRLVVKRSNTTQRLGTGNGCRVDVKLSLCLVGPM